MKPQRIEVLGVPVDCLTMATSLAFVKQALDGACGPCAVLAVNPGKIMHARRDARLHALLKSAGLLIPDGIGVVIAARISGACNMERVAGSELMPEICSLAETAGKSVFLFGARREVVALAAETLKRRYPSLRIAGIQNGYPTPDEIATLDDRINAARTDILFVALGSPAQELWLAEHMSRLRIKICQGVGGTFDVLAGTVKRAPALARRMNLEWLYRIAMQPRRLPRTLRNEVGFVCLLLMDRLRLLFRR